jgi:hypothetical protein
MTDITRLFAKVTLGEMAKENLYIFSACCGILIWGEWQHWFSIDSQKSF